MKAFLRVLKYVWPMRYLVLLAWLCAILAAVFYFFNIGSVLPLLDVMFGDQNGAPVGMHTVVVDGQEVKRPYVVIPPDYTAVKAEHGQGLNVNSETKVITYPPDYDPLPGGLQKYVVQTKGKFYGGAVEWAVEKLPQDRRGQLAAMMVIIVFMTGVWCLLRFVNGWLVGFVSCRSVLTIQERAFDKVIRLPMGFFHRGGGAEASSRLINDAFAVREGVQTLLGKVVMQPLMATASLTVAVFYAIAIDWRILILALVLGPLSVWIIRVFSSKMRRVTKKGLQTAASILDVLGESLGGLTVVKAYSMEGRERRRFFAVARRSLRFAVKAFKTQAATGPMLEFIGTLGIGAAVVLASYVLSDKVGAQQNQLMAFFVALIAAMDPLRKLADVNNRLQSAVNGSERLFELIDAEPESRSGTQGIELPRMSRELAFEDVHFRYNAESDEVLRGVSFRVAAGETVAIVGRTGCGKTTLVNLVPRFYVPTSGRVTIDGADAQAVTLRSLRDQIGVVSQDITLFSDTVAANIAYGSRPAMRAQDRTGKVTREEIEAAARMAHADEFISKLPERYDTQLGTFGKTLSGGQRQRLALARAIIRDPAILILDEATSALDEQTQSLVQDTLEKFCRNRTVIVIAHRLSTISLARRIVVMEGGRIVDIGPHEELMARCETYRRLRETGLQGG